MSRPFRTLFALCLVASSVGLSGCGTIYKSTYSNEKNYFKPPVPVNQKGQPQLTAEEILKQTDAQRAAQGGAYPPADAGGLPPAAPAATPDAMAPGAPAAPAAPATPPATPPPAQ